jgi:hypothetical protein
VKDEYQVFANPLVVRLSNHGLRPICGRRGDHGIAGASLPAVPEQDVDGEGAPVGAPGILERSYRVLRFVNELHYPIPGKGGIRSVISLLPLPLHKDEPLTKVLDFRRECPHRSLIVALISGVSVFQRPVGLSPTRVPSAGTDGASELFGAAKG